MGPLWSAIPALFSTAQGTAPPSGPQGLAYHNEVPHPGSLGHERGHGAAARHEDDLDRVIVE